MLPTYELTVEQTELQNLARDFAAREIAPLNKHYETASIDSGTIIEKICASGLVNTRIPEEYGGLGLSLFDTSLITEEFAYACSGISLLAEASELAITYLLIAGSQEQKKKFFHPLVEQSALAGIAPFSPADCGNDKLTAKQENESIILNGSCPIVLNATLAKWFLVSCPMPKHTYLTDNNLTEDLAYFIVPQDTKGISFSNKIPLLGRQAADARAVNFKNVELDSIYKIDPLNMNDKCDQINASIISSGCLGLASAAFNHAVKYSQGRQTFGLPIYKHQAIAFLLADMHTDLTASRMMIYSTIKSIKLGKTNQKLALRTQIYSLNMTARLTNLAVQIFGGYGYTKDYPVEKLMRDAKTYQSFYPLYC